MCKWWHGLFFGLNEAALARHIGRLRPVGRVQLDENIRDMIFNGAFSQHQPRGNLAVAGALSQQFEDIQFALAQVFLLGSGSARSGATSAKLHEQPRSDLGLDKGLALMRSE